MINRIKKRNRYTYAALMFMATIYGTMGFVALTSWASMCDNTLFLICLPIIWFVYLAMLGGLWWVVIRKFISFEVKPSKEVHETVE